MNIIIEELVTKTKNAFSNLEIEEVTQKENIKLLFVDLPNSLRGMYYSQDGINIIALSNNLTKSERKEVFWHEFYHYSLSVGNYISNNSNFSIRGSNTKEEKRADLFVSLMLIDEVHKEDSALSISEKFDVSENIARIRLEYEYKKISPNNDRN